MTLPNMILETGQVVAVETQGLWVETIQGSVCGSCHAQKGCGHSLLATMGAQSSRLWVLLDGRSCGNYRVGQKVTIGIPEDIIVKGSLLMYLLPLASMILFTLAAHHVQLSEGFTTLLAFAGLFLGAVIVRWRSQQMLFDGRAQPVVVDEHGSAELIQTCSQV